MKITILIPSRDYANNAGARIRYGRLAGAPSAGLELDLEDIAQFDPRTAQSDVLIISKCHDARSLLAASICARRGMKVGVDLFDDYFSQGADSRLNRLRLWLRQILPLCDFALCSTPLMEEVAGDYRPGIPTLVLNDPAPAFGKGTVSQLLRDKLADARAEGRLRVAWFGIGDNPHFPVGISDLAAFADPLSRLGTDNMAVELTILTNSRALNADRLAMIASLPVQTSVDEWSEQGEADLLRTSFACLLPVNAQRFSAAKSLNRAVTALASGCQVISAGYPLYAPLDEFIYRDAEQFLADARRGKMRYGAATVPAFQAAVDRLASPRRERESLRSFLLGLPSRGGYDQSGTSICLVHGHVTNGAAHKMVQSVGGLSVASPFCSVSLDFDVMFEIRPGLNVAMLVSDKGLSRMRPEARARATSFGPVGGRNFWEVGARGGEPADRQAWSNAALSLRLALYPSVMESIRDALTANFGDVRTIISENSQLPFEMVGQS